MKKNFFLLLFVIYLIVLLRITVFRSSLRWENLFQKGSIHLVLFAEYLSMLRQGKWFIFFYQFVGNIIWFLPFGAYLYGASGIRSVPKIVLLGFLLSLLIETLQFILGTGVSELDDLILNTFGVWIGAKTMRNRKGKGTEPLPGN